MPVLPCQLFESLSTVEWNLSLSFPFLLTPFLLLFFLLARHLLLTVALCV